MRRTAHTRTRSKDKPQPLHYIKIYTTPEIIEAFAARAAEQGRSVSKQGEFLVKQDLERFKSMKVA